jgi:hypothetical protein
MLRFSTACIVVLLLGPSLAGAQRQSPPFTRTEQRASCANYQPLRQPFFGELHLHTQYSADAATLDTRNTPRDAYRFARGEKVGLPPFVDTRTGDEPDTAPNGTGDVSSHPYCLPPERCQYTATRTIQLPQGRALDFAAITDHAEWLGETNICFWEEKVVCSQDNDCRQGQICFGADLQASGQGLCVPRGYASEACILAREDRARLENGLAAALFASSVTAENPQRLPFCDAPGGHGQGTCLFQAKNVWEQIQRDAEEAYDRTSQCSFTSFIAYEYTGMPALGQCSNNQAPCFADADCSGGATCTPNSGGANNLHRNIIFRNDDVVPLPLSYIEAPTGCGKGTECQQGGALASPQAMLEALEAQCQNRPGRCDFLSIPHNSNISGGAMFLLPESLQEATVRAQLEPLVELFQIKGSSECRFSANHPGAWNTMDELCDFENMSFSKLGGPFLADPDATTVLPSSYVRNALKEGLQYQQAHGVNPFQLGFVGALDSHNGTPGATDAVQYAKTGGHGDVSFAVSGQILNETNFLGLQTNGGGLTVVWAEENSRDSLFAAMQRRETYATSSTRPIVRFFGGFELPAKMCQQGDFAQQGYAGGVPMGGTLSHPASGAPRFAVSAAMDPGWQGHPGTKLHSIQIIKGWVDKDGQTHEAVYPVAGNPHSAADVDLKTCKPTGDGAADLCAIWTDPAFDPDHHAFYYARVLENPSCRWNQYYCNARGISCDRPPNTTSDTARYTEFEYQQCCSDAVPKTVQQRAWTSPIWYTPSK